MSSDIIEGLEDKKGNSLSLSMKANGFATLSLYAKDEHDYDRGPDIVDFYLPPNQDGINLANQIEDGLKAWRKQLLRNILR